MRSAADAEGSAADVPIIVWFRRDLRTEDHPALTVATARGRPVIPLFVWDERLLRAATTSGRRRDRLASAVAALDRDLRAIGGRLILRRGDPAEVVPRVVAETGARVVHATREHTPYARRRDAAVASVVDLRLHPGALLVEPDQLGETRVFTPFHRRWASAIGALDRLLCPPPGRIHVPPDVGSEGGRGTAPHGGPEALARLAVFRAGGADRYEEDRDRLDLAGTSRLSTDLHFGTLAPARAFHEIESAAFRRQLAWRDWAHHLLWFRPVARTAGWRDGRGPLDWRTDPADLAAWQDGRTGYPTVDAAMRQLAAEGWLNNRARMIAASFLTKDLLIDWRLGERHFLRQLVDGDVANNSLGWQWVAGIGTDAAPYHRIFNPVLQGQRFDPAGDWVRRWVPEVASVPTAHVHRPWDAPDGPPAGYPRPIVDHGLARQRALAWSARRSARNEIASSG